MSNAVLSELTGRDAI